MSLSRLSVREVQAFLDRIARAGYHAAPSPAAGTKLEFSGRGVNGAALVFEGNVVHLGASGWLPPVRPLHGH